MIGKKLLLSRKLPKWPQMLVTGKSLTPSQALSIIRRTDWFFLGCSGNDREFNGEALRLIHRPGTPCLQPNLGDSYEISGRDCLDVLDEWEKAWGVIPTQYVANEWISCAYAGGPYGWCHPDGTIGHTANIGKWPAVAEVYEDWRMIAREFPFVDAEVTLMDHSEGSSGNPVASFLIRNGEVEIVNPGKRNIHLESGREIPDDFAYESSSPPETLEGEHAISMEQIREWAGEFLQEHPEYCTEPQKKED